MFKHKKWSRGTRAIVTSIFAGLVMLSAIGGYNAPPTITLASSQVATDIEKTDDSIYMVEGNLSSLHSPSLSINDSVVKIKEDNTFSKAVNLREGSNTIKVVAISEKGSDTKSLTVYRTTKEELAERAKQIEQKKDDDERLAKRKIKEERDKQYKVSTAQDTKKESTLYKVVSITDGDTIKISLNGEKKTIRFIGFDTPETKDPRKPVQCFGREASSKMQSLVQSKRVRIQSDPSQGDKDKYGRLLRYVYLEDGRNVGYEMINQGFAKEYTYDSAYQYQSQFKSAEKKAIKAKKGLWSASTCNGKVNQLYTAASPRVKSMPQGVSPPVRKAPTPAVRSTPPARVSKPAPQSSSTSGVVKMSRSGICHQPGSTYYGRTTNFTPYKDINQCLGAGGRMPLR